MRSRRWARPLLALAIVTALAGATAMVFLGGGAGGGPRRDGAFTSSADATGCPQGGSLDEARRAAVCTGVDLAPAQRGFVPQGLVVADGVAFVSGYREGELGHRFCQLLVADTATGETSAFRRRVTGSVGGPGGERIVCRHGGGLALGPEGLWLAETGRLWLLDPAALARGADPVRRVWRLDRPVRGSALARRPGRLAVVGWAAHRRSWVHWVRVRDLLADGVTRVGPGGGPGAVVPAAARRVPSRVQGAAWRPGGLLLARSTTFCGELVSRRLGTRGFFPGAEGITFSGGRLWLVSEAGAGVYQRQGGRPDLPTLMSVRPGDLPGSDGCGWS
ncbi:hypothetical protein [Nocardioides sp.]|uniref:hypothetical protein n=1 Tax=Nocardioides sp. TaxID=35761 RepID=UPI003528D0FE